MRHSGQSPGGAASLRTASANAFGQEALNVLRVRATSARRPRLTAVQEPPAGRHSLHLLGPMSRTDRMVPGQHGVPKATTRGGHLMASQDAGVQRRSAAPVDGSSLQRGAADGAYRRAWLSLALYPVTLMAALAVGEGLISLLTNDADDAAVWQVLVAATPALLVLVVPGILAVAQGRKAMRLGRRDGRIPAIVAVTTAIGFIGLNVVQYVVGLVLG